MSLSQSLSIAMTGLRANQLALSLVSSNVANAETPGYVRKTTNQQEVAATAVGTTVRITGINRELDLYVQRQMRTEMSGAAYADLRSTTLASLQSIYGSPGSAGTIETAFNAFSNAVQALSTSPDSQAARATVIGAAQSLTQQLNATTQGIQSLRGASEQGIASSVNAVNTALSQIANINKQLLGRETNDASSAALLDQRDSYIDQLSQQLDVRVVANDQNQVTLFTTSGVQLVSGGQASKLSFNGQGTVSANTLWNSDPTKSNVGSITVNFPQGGSLDLVATNAIRSGKLAAYLELRDHSLVQAQSQVDQFAAALSSGLSDKTTDGTAVTGVPAGFNVDVAGLKAGNVIHLSYTNGAGTHNVSIVRVNDPSALPLPDTATNDPNDTVIGIDFSGGLSSVVTQLNAALGSAGVTFSNPSGTLLQAVDDGATNTSDVNAMSVTTTSSLLTAGGAELPLFTDGGSLYTGAIDGSGSQVTGFAGRISLNAAIVADPSRLVVYGTSPATAAGDTTRPDFIYSKLTSGSYIFSPDTGIGTTAQPFTGSLLNFTQTFVSQQGELANAAKQISDGQDVVLNTLKQKFNDTAGVNMDEEMAHLLALQNAYAANARVMSVVKDLFTTLFQIM